MKTIITTLFLAISHLMIANENLGINDPMKLRTQVVALKDSKIKIGIENPQNNIVELILRDDTTQIIFYKRFSKSDESMVQKLDLSELEDGNYSLTIYAGKENFRKSVKISTKSPSRIALVE
jgi:sRNA-binding carbon storage regulator CsrA